MVRVTKYNEIEGDLIALAKEGMFDVIIHGCNCFCTMGAGIAPQMAKEFGCNVYPLEDINTRGDINKLGQIDFKEHEIVVSGIFERLSVVNAYTQYMPFTWLKPLDYEALALCLRKINHIFNGLHIGLPQIGCGLAGGDWNRVKQIILDELIDCDITVVIYKPKTNDKDKTTT